MGGEPLIVVEETGGIKEEDENELSDKEESPSGPDSPLLNPYLLSPYRDLRKRSLPTPSCTSGITASQVRRLSEQGGETGKGPSPMEAAFLATLSSAPAPSAGGRRHSVVTISRAPQTSILFGRNRRESIATFPSSALPIGRLSRKDSSSSLARSPSISGSNFNLQLDIMDDIAEIKAARKVRLKMWQTENQEKICEVQPIEGGSTARYHQKENRRYSDVSGITASAPVQPKRRASELPNANTMCSTPPPGTSKNSGIICSNSEINTPQQPTTSAESPQQQQPKPSTSASSSAPTALDDKRKRLKNNRSNSFDISLLPDKKGADQKDKDSAPGNWFLKRHLPMANKKLMGKSEEGPVKDSKKLMDRGSRRSLDDKVVWDKPSGSVVDPQLIGSAIEEFLNQRSESPKPEGSNKKVGGQKSSWFGSETKETDEEVSCDNSICSTIKDLFVK
ncbi:hypothetical protein O3M35_008815 [Rhynocoris fuscipes]|uniref:Uncharacterized protein n=1 Tax=Rhynocoris fuscipes TaxID=488301 RepID=A0AAW1D7J9_9HEMI